MSEALKVEPKKKEVKEVVYLVGKSPKEMAVHIEKIEGPYKVISAYGLNSRHYLVIEKK